MWDLETQNKSQDILCGTFAPSQALVFLNSFSAFEKQTYGFQAPGMKQS